MEQMFLADESRSAKLQALPTPPIHLLRGASLFVDFDGTLVEIAERPDAVRVDASVQQLLRQLSARLDGRVALITGRPAAEVKALIGACVETVVGSHGLEFHWGDGRVDSVERPATLPRALAAMRELAAGKPGVLVEDKPFGVALHYRLAPAEEPVCIALALRLADDLGLELQHGRMVVEVRAGGGDKGSAVRALMREPAFFARSRPIFLGDDLTDEAGFLAAQAMDGAGILVGPERPTAAYYRLPGVAEVLAWLKIAGDGIS